MSARVLTGLDALEASGFSALRGRRLGVLCNQASITGDGRHILDVLLPASSRKEFEIVAVFGPQHGIWGHTQDNMIEWEGYRDPRTGLLFRSLYGEVRKPRREWLEGIDLFVADIPDVGARYYTFGWTLVLCLEAAAECGIECLVLDRPNPIGGVLVQGGVLDPDFKSFVGLRSVPARHGMTIGEVATLGCGLGGPNVEVVRCENWDGAAFADETGLLWAMPSPNMPSVETAVVYPGMCLLEGTNLSEGRGTTRPFEVFGAPFLDGWELCDSLNASGLEGVFFRPIQFQPTFQKHVGQVCSGAFLHVLDRTSFDPVLTACAVLAATIRRHADSFSWLEPPYEYEFVKKPFDILAGNAWLRPAIEAGEPIARIAERFADERAKFAGRRQECLLYARAAGADQGR